MEQLGLNDNGVVGFVGIGMFQVAIKVKVG
jgi:hypothetical protein